MRNPGNSRRLSGWRRGRSAWTCFLLGALLSFSAAVEGAYLSSGSFTITSNVRPYGTGGVYDGVDGGFTTPQSSANYGMKAGWGASLNLVGPLAIPVDQEIDVQGDGMSIVDGDVTPAVEDGTDFGEVNVDWATAPQAFAILNEGDLPLNIASVVSDNPEFAVSGVPTSVPGRGSQFFIVTFDPGAVGVREATITITSNDADEGSYDFKLRGEGTATLEVDAGRGGGGGGGQPRLIVVGGLIEFRDETDSPVVVINPATPTPLVINGTAGDDNLTVNFGGGNPIPPAGLVYHGGGQGMNGDTLTISGGSGANTVTYTFNNENDGAINYDGSTITYTGLEPVIDNMDAVSRIFNFTGGEESIQVTGAGMTQTMIDSTQGESVTFNNPTVSMFINAGTGDDQVDVLSLSGGWGAAVAITVNGGDGDDFVSLNKTVATAAPITVNGDAHVGGDSLHLSPEGDGSIMKNVATITGGGIQTVNFATVETVTVNERPEATLASAPNVTQANAGQNSYSFTVTYTDADDGVVVGTIDTMDVTVTGPGGPVAIIMATEPSGANGSPKTATYTFTPPGGTWNDADNGTYNIAMAAGQVNDSLASAVAAGALGSFTVTMDTTAPTVTTPVADQANVPFQRSSYTVASDFADPPPAPTMLSYAIQSNTDNMVATASVDGSGVVTLNDFTKLGSTTVTVRATDQGGNVADDSFTLTVVKADTTISITADNPDPSETDEMTTVNFTLSVTAPGTGAPVAPTGMVTIEDGDNSVMVAVGTGTGSTTFATSGAKTITATYAGDGNFNGSMDTEAHVVNNPPVFSLTTDPLTINSMAAGFGGPNLAVQSESAAAKMFTVGDLAKSISSDDLATGNETGQTVSFVITANDNPGLFAVQPAIADSAGPGFAAGDLTFTATAGATGIANITVRAEDDGFGGGGQQASATQDFSITIYGAQPFPGDLVIADRGSRVFSGEVLLVHDSTPATDLGYPTQNLVNDQLVDAYEIAIHTNKVAGKDQLEYLVIDYETVVSAKGRGRQGLYGVNAVSQARRTISTGQHFSIPISVEVFPHEAGARAGHIVVGDSGLSEADPGKVITIDPATGTQTLLTQGMNLYWLTGMTVAPGKTTSGGTSLPHAGWIFTTDIGSVFAKTANKNDHKREIIQIKPDGTQTVLISQTNDFRRGAAPISNLWHPTGIDVDPVSGDLYIADSFSRTVWKLDHTGGGAFAVALETESVDDDFIQPVHIAVSADGSFLYVTDGATITPGAAYASDTRLLHKVTVGGAAASNSTIYSQDGFFKEPRGIEIVPVDPLTGN